MSYDGGETSAIVPFLIRQKERKSSRSDINIYVYMVNLVEKILFFVSLLG